MEDTTGSMVPKSVKGSIKRYAGIRRRVKLNISSGSNDVAANGILRVRLPQGLVDLPTFSIAGTFSCPANHRCAGLHSLISRFGCQFGQSQMNFQNTNYNLTAHALNLASQGLEWEKSNAHAGVLPTDFTADGEYIEGNYFPLTPLNSGMLMTSVIGECEIDIAFAGNEALVVPLGVTPSTDVAWVLSNIDVFVDVIEMETDDLAKTITSRLASGGSYEKSVRLAHAVIQSNNGANAFNLSTGCLDYVMVAPKVTGYKTLAAQTAGQVYSNYFDSQVGAAYPATGYGAYVEINSTSFPQAQYTQNYAGLAQITRSCFGNASSYNYNKLFLTADASGSVLGSLDYNKTAYTARNGVAIIPVGAFDEEGVEGGLDISSGTSIIQVNSRGENLLTRRLLLAGLHKSRLVVKSGKTVAFQQ